MVFDPHATHFATDCRTCGNAIQILTPHDQCGRCRKRAVTAGIAAQALQLGIPKSEWHRIVALGPWPLDDPRKPEGERRTPYALRFLGLIHHVQVAGPDETLGWELIKVPVISDEQEHRIRGGKRDEILPGPCVKVTKRNAVVSIQMWDQILTCTDVRPYIRYIWHPLDGPNEETKDKHHARDQHDLALLERGAQLYLRPQSGGGPGRKGLFGSPEEARTAIKQAIVRLWDEYEHEPSSQDVEMALFGKESKGRQLRRSLVNRDMAKARYTWTSILAEVRSENPDLF